MQIEIKSIGFEKAMNLTNKLLGIPMLVAAYARTGVPMILRRSAEKTMTSQGRGTWKPLSPITIDDRKARGFAEGPILQRNGDLLRDIQSSDAQISQVGSDIRLTMPAPNSMKDKYYAHQTGTPGGAPFLPQRVMYRVWDEDFAEIIAGLKSLTIESLRM